MKEKQPRWQDLPRYRITFDEDGNQGVNMVSLVKDPATELKGMMFSADELKKELQFQFKSIPDQQIIVGYAMVPNKDILRKDKNGNPYLVFFDKETVLGMASKFNRENSNKSINVDHGDRMAPAYIRENWITENEQYDKMKMYGFQTYMFGWAMVMKIEDKQFWEDDVKNAGRYSFSIEGLMDQEPVDMQYQKQYFNNISKYTPEFFDTLTERELRELWFEVSIDDIPVHPNCQCEIDGVGEELYWMITGDNTCDECRDLQEQFNSLASDGNIELAKQIFEKHTGRKLNKRR